MSSSQRIWYLWRTQRTGRDSRWIVLKKKNGDVGFLGHEKSCSCDLRSTDRILVVYGTSTLFYTTLLCVKPSQVKQRKAMQKQGVLNLVGFDLFEDRVPANARIMPSPNQQFQFTPLVPQSTALNRTYREYSPQPNLLINYVEQPITQQWQPA